MKRFVVLLVAAAASAVTLAQTQTQNFAPPPPLAPDKAKLDTIRAKSDQLGRLLLSLKRRGVQDMLLAEVEVFQKAADWIVRHNEWFTKESADQTLDVLDRGLFRAGQLSRGEAPWLQEGGQAVVRAYRSRIDESVQPYAITFPQEYGRDPRRRWRLDVVLHGRDSSLTEVKFIAQHNEKKLAPKGQNFILLEIYGRGNNAYRWAGESDVLEAIDAFALGERYLGREMLVDPTRIVLRGFSMGGAGTWHLGLHRPARWCAMGPGAGFSTTKGYAPKLPDPMPAYQDACLHIYDAVDYAENAFNIPIVAYAGELDKQLQAARNIEAKLKPLGIPMTLLVAPGLEHKFPPEWQAKAEAEYARITAKAREEYPRKVKFVTYTTKYNLCHWVEIVGLEQHYRKARVDAEQTEAGYTVKTENVRILHLGMQPGSTRQPVALDIDGQKLEARPYLNASGELHLYLEKRGGQWASTLPEKVLVGFMRRPQKRSGLQGPIDDAFMAPFLVVRGTGKAWHEGTQQYAAAALERFQKEWDKYLRGELPVKDDVDVTPEDVQGKHLVLFGDPGSNTLIEQVVSGLPLKWTPEKITLAGKEYAAAENVPVLIHPSPLHPERYVVLNSGHTFHAADFQATNAMLFPRLGDYAVLKRTPSDKDPLAVEVQTAGLFDEFWQPAAR